MLQEEHDDDDPERRHDPGPLRRHDPSAGRWRLLRRARARGPGGAAPREQRRRIHVPDAPAGASERPGQLPDLRHGAGAARRDGGFRREPRAPRHDASLLDRPGTRASGVRAGDGKPRCRPAPCHRPANLELDSTRPRNAGRALGRVAVLRQGVGFGEEPEPEHVQPHRPGDRRLVALQHRRYLGAPVVPVGIADDGRRRRRLLRGRRRHHRLGPARPGARVAGSGEDVGRDPRAARSGAQGGGAGQGRWRGRTRCARHRPGRQPAARTARRKSACRRRADRGQRQCRRVDGHRRADAGVESGRLESDGRHAESNGRLRDACREGRRRHAAVADRSHGVRGPAQPGADPAHGRPRRGLVRPGGHRRVGGRVRRMDGVGPEPGVLLCAHRRCRRPHHRLSVRTRPGDADVDHGGGRARRTARCAHPRRGSAGAHGKGRYPRRRQDGDADRRPAEGRRRACGRGVRCRYPDPDAGQRRAGQRASVGRSHRRRRRDAQAAAAVGRRFRFAGRQGCDRRCRRSHGRLRKRQIPGRIRHRRVEPRRCGRDSPGEGSHGHLRRHRRTPGRLRRHRRPDQGQHGPGHRRASQGEHPRRHADR